MDSFSHFKTDYGMGVNADCFDAFRFVKDQSVDMIFCDLPYGMTGNEWDILLPFDKLWAEYWRICRGAVVLTSIQPFTSLIVASQIRNFRCDWVWKKQLATGHYNAKKMPMRNKEDILVFYQKNYVYNPQMTEGEPYQTKAYSMFKNNTYGKQAKRIPKDNFDGLRYPLQILEFPLGRNDHEGQIHPTQKPISLVEYFIKTYSNEGDLVLDNCAGSMSTGIAAENLKRRWLCIEQDSGYYDLAKERILKYAYPFNC